MNASKRHLLTWVVVGFVTTFPSTHAALAIEDAMEASADPPWLRERLETIRRA